MARTSNSAFSFSPISNISSWHIFMFYSFCLTLCFFISCFSFFSSFLYFFFALSISFAFYSTFAKDEEILHAKFYLNYAIIITVVDDDGNGDDFSFSSMNNDHSILCMYVVLYMFDPLVAIYYYCPLEDPGHFVNVLGVNWCSSASPSRRPSSSSPLSSFSVSSFSSLSTLSSTSLAPTSPTIAPSPPPNTNNGGVLQRLLRSLRKFFKMQSSAI